MDTVLEDHTELSLYTSRSTHGPCLARAALAAAQSAPSVLEPLVLCQPLPLLQAERPLWALPSCCSHVGPIAPPLVLVLHLLAPAFHAGASLLLLRWGTSCVLTCIFISWKYEGVNPHVADFHQQETDAEGHVLFSSSGQIVWGCISFIQCLWRCPVELSCLLLQHWGSLETYSLRFALSASMLHSPFASFLLPWNCVPSSYVF